jgi:hypothetical protein
MAIPAGESRYRIVRWGWGGLNKTSIIDTGDITDADGVYINPPYVDAAPSPTVIAHYTEPVGIFAFSGILLVLYRQNGKIMMDYRTDTAVYTGIISDAKGTDEDFLPRSIVQFNVAENTENIVSSTYNRRLLIFPDKVAMDRDITASGFVADSLGDAYPNLKYATVYGSRVFGVDDNLVYASSYNDYADWDLDTADDVSDANAWVSMSQSNVKADGAFTDITIYDNHVVLFKRDFTQLVYNNKNPFRIVDVTAYGDDNPFAVTETEGTLFFASKDMVYAFTGGIPQAIAENIAPIDLRGACMGSYKDRTYICAGNMLYRFKGGAWSQKALQSHIRQFASNETGLFGITEDGDILAIDSQELGNTYTGTWYFETDLMASGRLDIRRVKKISVLCQIEEGASLSVYLLKDFEKFDADKSHEVLTSSGHGMRTLCCLVRGTSAGMHRLRFVGNGKVRIYALEMHVSWGGEIYKET